MNYNPTNVRVAWYKPDGDITSIAITTDYALQTATELWLEAPMDVGFDTHYVDVETKQFVRKPMKPVSAIVQVWDHPNKRWKGIPEFARMIRKKQLEKNRDTASNEPMELQGHRWDVDDKALAALRLKAEELADAKPGDEYPEMLLWRDADNVTRTFGSASQMRQFVSALLRAVARRRARVHAKAWARKAALESTPDDEVEGFDPSLG